MTASAGSARQRWAGRLRRPDVLAVAALLLGALAFYFPLVFLGRELVDYDAFVYFYPQRAYLGQMLRQGVLPLWDPDLFLGVPFLANPQTAVLYPPSWLFAIGSVVAGYTVQLVGHAVLAGFFTYQLARRALGAGALAALVGALAYAFGGFTVGQVGHLNQLSAAAWVPAVLLCYQLAITRRSVRWVALGGLALGLQILAGHPQESYMTVLALALLGIVQAPWRSPVGLAWAAGAGVAIGALAGLISAAQLLPTLELTPLSIRGAGVSWEDAVAGSVPAYLMPRALLPPYWLPVDSTEYLGYVGMVPVTLGFLALVAQRSRWVAYGAVLCFLGIFLAVGENNGWYAVLFGSVPGFSTFRVPARWLFLWMIGATVLAILGADWVVRGAPVDRRRWDVWARAVVVGLVLMTGLAWQRSYGEPWPQRRTALAWSGLAVAALGSGALAILGKRRLAGAGLVVLTAGELLAASNAAPFRQAPPGALLYAESQAGAYLHAHPNPGRLLSVAQASYIPAEEGSLRAQMQGTSEQVMEALLVARKWQETLIPNLPLEEDVRAVDGYDGGVLPLEAFVQLSGLLVPPAEVRPDGVLISRLSTTPPANLLDLLGVTDVLVNSDAPNTPGSMSVNLGNVRLDVRQPDASLASLVYDATVAGSDADALVALGAPGFDPRQTIVLDEAAALPSTGDSTAGEDVQPTRVSAEEWDAQVTATDAGYLLQKEAWYPGWRATVDGQPAPVLRADLLYRGVPVPAGTHHVRVWFDSSSFSRGALLSLAGLVLALLGLSWPWIATRLPIMPGRARSADTSRPSSRREDD